MCPPSIDGICSITLINLPDFHSVVRTNLNGNKVMKVKGEQLRKMISKKIGFKCPLPHFQLPKELSLILSNQKY